MDRWESTYVESITDLIQYGYTGKVKSTGDYKYLRITDIQNEKVNWDTVPFCDIPDDLVEKYRLANGDILFARTGATVGKSYIFNDDVQSVFASYLIRLVPGPRVFAKYLYLFFQSQEYWDQIRGYERGAAQPNVNGKKLGKIKFPLPPISEQELIVSKIEIFFARIDKSIILLQQNLLYTQALKSSVLDEELNRVSNLQESKLPDLINEMISGFACNKSNEKPNGYVHLRTHNIDFSGTLNFDQLVRINPKKVDPKKNQLKRGDVLFNNTNSKELVGKTALVDQDYDYGFSNHLTRIRVDENLISPEYLVNYFLNLHQQGYFLRICKKWIGQAGVNSTMLKETLIRYPSSLKDQELINEKVRTVNARSNELIKEIETKIDNLKALKSSLLDKAFRGEL